jgi:hypothetical protein
MASALLAGRTPQGITDDDWATPAMSFDEFSAAIDALGLATGSGEPWPPLDPEFASAEAFSAAVRAAPRVTAADVLAKSGKVGVHLSWTPAACDLLGTRSEDVWLDIVRALKQVGVSTDASADVVLELVLNLQTAEVGRSLGSRSLGSESVLYLGTSARLVVPARVPRGAELHHASCALASHAELRVRAGTPTRELLVESIHTSVAGLFARARSGGGFVPDAATLERWLAGAGAPAALTSFSESRRGSRELDAGLGAVAGFRSLRAGYVGADAIPALFFLDRDGLQSHWRERLRGAGFAVELAEGPELVNDVLLARDSESSQVDYVSAWFSRVALVDPEALAVVEGELVRVAGETWTAQHVSGGVPSKTLREMQDDAAGVVNLFLQSLGQGGERAGQALHAEAAAAAAYLRTRLLTELPEPAVLSVANRIALALSPLDPEWLIEIAGERQLYLPYVGRERARNAALDRAIDELTRADPLGLYAFDNLWNFDPTPERYRPVLPAGYARRFEGPRPSGNGALSGERVRPFSEYLTSRLQLVEDFQRRGAIQQNLRELEQALQGASVLCCEYLPKDGSMSYVETRAFWYQAVPKGWSDLLPRFAPELHLEALGPALAAGPDHLDQADAQLAAR